MEKLNLLHTDVVRQHTVPRFLLENFSFISEKNKRSKQVFAFNKQNKNVVTMSLNDATVHSRFYNLKKKQKNVSIESLLSLYEGRASTVIRNLLSHKDVKVLTEKDRGDLARFVTVQWLRSRGEYENQKHIAQSLYNSIKSKGINDEKIEAYFSDENFERNSKGNFLSQIVNCDFEVSVISGKEWLLFETKKDRPFYISDNPVTLYNDIDFGYWSNTGIALQGIQIYLPISSTLTLAMICPSIFQKLREEREFIYKCIVNKIGGKQLNVFERLDFLKSMLDTRQVHVEDWRLRHLNNLQLWRSERFIFSSLNEFEQDMKLLEDCPELIFGPRSTVS